ncbi:MAG: cytidine deaminase, partial [Sphingomicrobium sp.]
MTDQELIAAARTAALRAYAPYSRFSVGCAIESIDGEVVTGANMENACYRLGVCAELSALTAAQAAFGLDRIKRIAVAGGVASGESLSGETVVTPCGGCRQSILEAAHVADRDLDVVCASGDGQTIETHSIG